MVLRISDCTIDIDRHEFRRAGQAVHLEPQVFDLLHLLARSPGQIVSREKLIETVWRGLNVSDSTISARISAARAAVGDTGTAQKIIQTIPRRGYRLVDTRPQSGEIANPKKARSGPGQIVKFARSTDGTRIAYEHSGTGPPLVRAGHWLSHLELDWNSPVWRPLIDALGETNTLYRYDQRGTGLSDRSAPLTGIEDFVADFAAVVDHAGLDRFAIYAPSQSAPVALRYAAEHPDRVQKIAILGGYAEGRAIRSPSAEDADKDTMVSLIRSGWGRYGSPFVKAFSSLFLPDATAEQINSFVEIQLESATPDVAVKLRQLVDHFDVVDFLPRVQAPVLVMHSRGDVIHPPSQGRLLASQIPNARFVTLESNNHAMLDHCPSWPVYLSELREFLSDD